MKKRIKKKRPRENVRRRTISIKGSQDGVTRVQSLKWRVKYLLRLSGVVWWENSRERGEETRSRGAVSIVRKVAQKITRRVYPWAMPRCFSPIVKKRRQWRAREQQKWSGGLMPNSVSRERGVESYEREGGVETERGRTVIILVLLRPHPSILPSPSLHQLFFSILPRHGKVGFLWLLWKKPVFQGDYFGGNSFLARYCSRSRFATRFERKKRRDTAETTLHNGDSSILSNKLNDDPDAKRKEEKEEETAFDVT